MTKIVRKPETPTLLLTRSKIQRGPTVHESPVTVFFIVPVGCTP